MPRPPLRSPTIPTRHRASNSTSPCNPKAFSNSARTHSVRRPIVLGLGRLPLATSDRNRPTLIPILCSLDAAEQQLVGWLELHHASSFSIAHFSGSVIVPSQGRSERSVSASSSQTDFGTQTSSPRETLDQPRLLGLAQDAHRHVDQLIFGHCPSSVEYVRGASVSLPSSKRRVRRQPRRRRAPPPPALRRRVTLAASHEPHEPVSALAARMPATCTSFWNSSAKNMSLIASRSAGHMQTLACGPVWSAAVVIAMRP